MPSPECTLGQSELITVVHFAASLLDDEGMKTYFLEGWHAKVARQLAEREKGYNFECWVPTTLSEPLIEKRGQVTYRAFPATRGLPTSYWKIIAAVRDLRQKGPVIFHIHDCRSPSVFYFLVCLSPRIPIIIQDHGFLTNYGAFSPLEAVLFRRVERFYVINRYAERYLTELGIDIEKVGLQMMGVDFDIFKQIDRQVARKKLGMPPDSKLILYVGQFVEWKGFRAVIEAVEEMKHPERVRIAAVGGNAADPLHDFANEKCDYVFLRNKTPTTLLPYLYSAADVTCQYYFHQRVGLGVNLMESLACGTPVVSNTLMHFPDQSEIGDIGKYVDSPGALSQAIAEVLQRRYDPLRLRSIALTHFGWDSIARRTLADYSQILKRI